MKIHTDQFNRRHALPRSDVRSSCFTDAPLNCRDHSMACHERSLVIERTSRRATDRPLTRHGASRHTTYAPATHHRVVSSNLRYAAVFQNAFRISHDNSSWTRRVETTAVDANESGNGKNCVMKKSEPGEIQKTALSRSR